MLKVLGNSIPTEKCIQILELTNWDVWNAIKVVNLEKMVIGIDLATINSALEATSWDVAKAEALILQQDEEMQV